MPIDRPVRKHMRCEKCMWCPDCIPVHNEQVARDHDSPPCRNHNLKEAGKS